MRTFALRLALPIVVLVATATVATAAAGAGTDPASAASVPVTGTTAAGDAFAGTMTISDFALQNGQLVAIGTVSGAAQDPTGNTVATVADAPVTAPMQTQQASTGCTVLSFSTGPVDVDVAGQLNVHLEPIAGKVGLSGLVGTLVCALLGGGA
jgi:hypothetical protein